MMCLRHLALAYYYTLLSVLEEGGVWQNFKNVTRGGSDEPKMLQEGVLNRRGGVDRPRRIIRVGLTKWSNKYIFFKS